MTIDPNNNQYKSLLLLTNKIYQYEGLSQRSSGARDGNRGELEFSYIWIFGRNLTIINVAPKPEGLNV